MIKSLEINDFKGINKFKLDNLNRVNIFVGKNNSNKTSILEGIYIGIDDNHMGIVEILQKRGLNPSSKMMDTLFYNLNIEKEIKIKLQTENISIETFLSLLSDENNFIFSNSNSINSVNVENQEEKKYFVKQIKNNKTTSMIYKFGFIDRGNGQIEFITNVEINNLNNKKGIKPKNEKVYYFSPKAQFDSNFINKLREQIKSKNEKQKIIKELQLFDSKIEDIIVDGLNIEIYLKEIDKPLPLQALGAGSRTILELASILSNENINIILIDELESGLHIESMKSIAKYISKSVEKNKELQLFLTTHSSEIIKLIGSNLENKKDISAFRLYNKNNEMRAVEYLDDLLETLEDGWEIR